MDYRNRAIIVERLHGSAVSGAMLAMNELGIMIGTSADTHTLIPWANVAKVDITL